MATAAAAVVAKARRDVISHFMQNNAISPENAVAYAPDRRVRRRMLERFIDAGVIHKTSNGYWLDVPRWDTESRKRRRRIGLGIGLGAMIAAAAAMLA
jgi:hypothetical protein